MEIKLFAKRISIPLFLILVITTNMIYAQNTINISGRVSSSIGEPMIGASIMVKGTTNGTITDLDGNFRIETSPTATLIISYVGYVTQEVQIAGRKSINIILKDDTGLLEEIVVVGYGTQKKETLTGSVTSVKGDEIKRSPAPNVSTSLQGKLPGLIVNQRSGEPGRDDPSIVIRGFGTFGDSSPLIIIDGVERGNMSRMNPEDIESISVLKDASAAIYGARAANGVILITTKKGKVGKPEFSLGFNTAFLVDDKI